MEGESSGVQQAQDQGGQDKTSSRTGRSRASTRRRGRNRTNRNPKRAR